VVHRLDQWFFGQFSRFLARIAIQFMQ